MQSAAAIALMPLLIIAAYTAAVVTYEAFQWAAGQPLKIACLLKDLDPHLTHCFLSFPSNQHVDRFSCFCRAHERDQQTDIQTDHATLSVAIGASNYCCDAAKT